MKDTSAGFIFFQEMPASAINDALIPVKKAFFALHFSIVSHNSNSSHIAHVLNHFLGLFTKWVVGITIGAKRKLTKHYSLGNLILANSWLTNIRKELM